MTRPRKRKIALSLLTVASALSIGLLLLVAKLRSNTPTMAFHALISALQHGDQTQINNLSTLKGMKPLRNMTARYSEKRLGNYLWRHRTVQPVLHLLHLPTVVVFGWNKTKSPALFTVFFRWTWDGWKLSSINGTPS